MSRMFLLSAAALLAIAGCSSSDPAPGSGAQAKPPAAPSAPQVPDCKTVFVVGQVIDAAKGKAGCTDPNGGVQLPGSFTCSDGRELFQVDANTGAASGWGFSNGKYTASKEAATDPKYHAAYKKCTS